MNIISTLQKYSTVNNYVLEEIFALSFMEPVKYFEISFRQCKNNYPWFDNNNLLLYVFALWLNCIMRLKTSNDLQW